MLMPKYHASDYHDKINSVTVNGAVVPGVFFVDTDAGLVKAYRLLGGFPYAGEDGKIATEERTGKIEIEWADGYGPNV